MKANGAHLPATLARVARASGESRQSSAVLHRVAARVSELVGDIRQVAVEHDERRETLTLVVTHADGSVHEARALSDGTLRFLALATLEEDPLATGVICLEEPENGIHPLRIEPMVTLLNDIAVDADMSVGPDNPLRQVIVNTHSPAVIAQVKDADLVVARLSRRRLGDLLVVRPTFHSVQGTWRDTAGNLSPVPRGELLALLQPVPVTSATGSPRVVDRDDLQLDLPFAAG
jgi:predicted ATPase